MTHTDSVRARFNGADITFRIHRDDLPYFEAGHGSAYGLYRRIISGDWTVRDIATVLRFAKAPRPHKGADNEFARMRAALDVTLAEIRDRKPHDVDAAFTARGPGTYAPLAAAILIASLTGIPEAEAHFTDEDGEAE